tara:strand:+ start:3727 stop:4476 length:750 start_codon:yes stop_codon:yes gene_type:complete
MQGYFSYLPEINYVSRSPDRNSNDEFIRVKNIFKRAKIREDMLSVVTAFDDYTIIGDGRPEQVAQKLYGDPRFDWVVLIANNITRIRDQWPLTENDFRNYLLDKYGSDKELEKIHHYETKGLQDDHGRLVVPPGLVVDSNFSIRYLERNQVRQTTVSYGGSLDPIVSVDEAGTAKDANGNIITHENVFPVSNYMYELDINESKRKIKVVRPIYLNSVVSDMQKAMNYKRSSQFVNKRLKTSDNPRLRGG